FGLISSYCHVPISVLVSVSGYLYLSRRYEYAADRQGAALTGDPEAMITALARLRHLSQMPLNWSRWEEQFLTHPSHSHRTQALAKTYAIPQNRIDTLLNNCEADGERYSLTETGGVPASTSGAAAAPARSPSPAVAKKPAKLLLLNPLQHAFTGLVFAF